MVLEPGNYMPGATVISIVVSALSFRLARVLCVEIAEGGGAEEKSLAPLSHWRRD